MRQLTELFHDVTVINGARRLAHPTLCSACLINTSSIRREVNIYMNARTTYGARDCSDYRVAQKNWEHDHYCRLNNSGARFSKNLRKNL